MRASNILLAIVMFTPVAADAQFAIRPGQYEYTLEMDLSSMGMSKEDQDAVLGAAGLQKQNKQWKHRDCITAEQVNEMKDPKGFAQVFAREAQDDTCKASDVKMTGSTVVFVITCGEGRKQTVINTQMTVGTDSFTGFSTTRDHDGQVGTTKMSAKRVGDCTK